MGVQSNKWLESEGDAWHGRNVHRFGHPSDPVIDMLLAHNLVADQKFILEVGCADGHRLARLRDEHKAKCWGVDLSTAALNYGLQKYGDNDLQLRWRKASNLHGIPAQSMDIVIYGFCLYAVDPQDLFNIVAEGNRVLNDGGHLIIHDFYPFHTHAKPYHHDPLLKTYKMKHIKLFTAHPAYKVIDCELAPHEKGEELNNDTQTAITLLRKDMANAFPLEP